MARLFNIISIAALLTLILFVTAFFFIGSQETFDRQLDKLPEYFFRRAAGGIVIGILGCVIVAAGDLLFNKEKTDRRVRVFRTVLLTLLLSVVTSVTGTAIFFYR